MLNVLFARTEQYVPAHLDIKEIHLSPVDNMNASKMRIVVFLLHAVMRNVSIHANVLSMQNAMSETIEPSVHVCQVILEIPLSEDVQKVRMGEK